MVSLKKEGLLFCLCGPAGVGKNACGERLVSEFKLPRLVTATSRAPRSSEKDGIDYHFIARAEFESKIKQNFFYEWEEIHGNLYGTPRQLIDQTLASGSELLLIIDISGTLNFKQKLPKNTCITFIMPPSYSDLAKRMQQRGPISAEDVAKRLKTAEQEWQRFYTSTPGQIDYLIVNEDLDRAYQEVRAIFLAQRASIARIERKQLLDIWQRR